MVTINLDELLADVLYKFAHLFRSQVIIIIVSPTARAVFIVLRRITINYRCNKSLQLGVSSFFLERITFLQLGHNSTIRANRAFNLRS
jgi:hypothetical protein